MARIAFPKSDARFSLLPFALLLSLPHLAYNPLHRNLDLIFQDARADVPKTFGNISNRYRRFRAFCERLIQ
jgi:hypothetical protein